MDRFDKTVLAAALIRDDVGGVLIVRPSYREDWSLPGGGVQQGEPPKQGCERVLKEALGIKLTLGHLLCLDYQTEDARGIESLTFVFDAGEATPDNIIDIALPENKLSAFEFAAPSVAVEKLNASLGRCLRYALAAQHNRQTLYLENKELI